MKYPMNTIKGEGDIVWYKGIEYPVRICDYPMTARADGAEGKIQVGYKSLEDILISKAGGYPFNKEAERVDAEIYCYVPDDVFEEFDQFQLQLYIDANFD